MMEDAKMELMTTHVNVKNFGQEKIVNKRSIYHVQRDIRNTTAIILWVEDTVAGLTNVGLLLKRVGATVTGSSGWAMIGVAIAMTAMMRLLRLASCHGDSPTRLVF